jgi:hypothetical protein
MLNQKTYCMNYSLPRKIKNHLGEELIFHRPEINKGEEKLNVENYVQPNTPPIKHIFYQQDEWLMVLHSKMGYQLEGGSEICRNWGDCFF